MIYIYYCALIYFSLQYVEMCQIRHELVFIFLFGFNTKKALTFNINWRFYFMSKHMTSSINVNMAHYFTGSTIANYKGSYLRPTLKKHPWHVTLKVPYGNFCTCIG